MELKELQEEYTKLKPLMFPGILEKLSQIDEKCTKITTQTLIMNRANTYMTYAQSIEQHTKPAIKSETLLLSSSLQPKDTLRCFEPLEVQSITMLLKSIISDAPKFVDALLSKTKIPEFFPFALITLPAIYSFYTTKESTGFAFNFYLELARRADFDVFITLVSPFFNSPICSTFSNILFKKLFWKNFESGLNEQIFCQTMLDNAMEYFTFLPEQVIILLRMLKLQWDNNTVWKLIVRAFLFPQYELHSLVSPFSYNHLVRLKKEQIKSILYTIGDPRQSTSLTLPILKFDSSYKEIPETFIAYQRTFMIDTILTTQDVRNLLALGIDIPHHTPRLQALLQNQTIDSFLPFFLHFYPKLLIPPQMTYRKLFKFPDVAEKEEQKESSMLQLWSTIESAAENIGVHPLDLFQTRPIRTGEALLDLQLNTSIDLDVLHKFGLESHIQELTTTANILEQLLQHNMIQSGLSEWLEECTTYSYDSAMRTSSLVMTKLTMKPDAIQSNFWTYVTNYSYGSQQIGIWLAIYLLEKIEPMLIKKKKKLIDQIEKRYKKLLIIKNSSIESSPRFPSIILKTHMWETSGMLQFASNDTKLSIRYILLISFMQEIDSLVVAAGFEDSLEKITEILCFSFAEGKHVWIMRTMIVLAGAMFNDQRFSHLCPTSMYDKWRKFSAAFIQFISADIELLTKYGEVASPDKDWLN